MEFVLERVSRENQYILDNVLELYLHEFNEFYNYCDDLDENGRYNFMVTDKYVEDKSHKAYLIKVNGKIAGFIMINNETKYVKNGIYCGILHCA